MIIMKEQVATLRKFLKGGRGNPPHPFSHFGD